MVKKSEVGWFDMDVIIQALTRQIGKEAEDLPKQASFKKSLRAMRRQKDTADRGLTAKERKAEYENDKRIMLLAHLFSVQETVELT